MKKKVTVIEVLNAMEIKLAREIKEFMKKKGKRDEYKLQEGF